MRSTARLSALLACALCACGLENDVGQNAGYTFLPGSDGIDSTPYPLRHLLILENDAESERTYVYLFSGELGAAGVGVPDLRRIARHYGGFQMAFDPPRERYLDEAITSRGTALSLQLARGETIELQPLDDAALGPSGASRWLSTVTSDDFDVSAYFGVLERSGELPELTIEGDGFELAHTPQLTDATLAVEIADDVLTLRYEGAEAADTLQVDLWQHIASKEPPHTEVEAAVRTLLPANAPYATGKSLVTDAAGKGCWSTERPLGVRLTQIARDWDAGKDGDTAVVHVKLDAVWLEPDVWTPLLDEPMRSAYCKDYQ